ncbi:MAG: hypothetical protein V1702_02500 [Candidatus Woesearchaeota archaeon]
MGKAQIFLFDLMISIGIFVTAVVIFIFISNNIRPDESDFGLLVESSEAISSSLLSAGEPADWTDGNVTLIGITDDSYRLNFTKVQRLHNLSLENSSSIFGANSNFAIFFKDMDGNVMNLDGCAYSNAGLVVQNLSPSVCENITITPDNHLVNIERLVMYNSEIIKIVVQAWI